MTRPNRRSFLQTAAQGALLAVTGLPRVILAAAETAPRKFKLSLNLGNIGVKASPLESIELAKRFGYEMVAPMPGALRDYSTEKMSELLDALKKAGLAWSAAGTSPFFEPDDAKFAAKRAEIGQLAAVLQRAGATRCTTWTMSSNASLTYRDNFRLHVRRIQEVGKLLGDSGIRLGVEYLGTRTLTWQSKYPFVRTLAEMMELLTETKLSNVGVVLDTWHWWQAGDTADDLLKLKPEQIITADICDAPASPQRQQLPDSPRRLPCVTGVIDVKSFLLALIKLNYDGPVGTEPFDKSLGEMPVEQAMATSTAAVKKAIALIE